MKIFTKQESYKLAYLSTVYLPLRIRDLGLAAIGVFIKREHLIEAFSKLLKGRSLRGMLPDGNAIFYPLDDFKLLSIISEIYHKKIYNSKQIASFNSICDVGAHIGLFTLWVSAMAPNSRITAIEPNKTNFKFLCRNIFANRLEYRVKTFNVAAGDEKRKVDLWVGKLSRGDGSIVNWHAGGSVEHYQVNMCPLDEILPRDKDYDLIKIDAEGAEIGILRGLQKTLRKTNRIVMELHLSVIQITDVYKILDCHSLMTKRNQTLSESCLLLEAQHLRNCGASSRQIGVSTR